MCDHCPWYKRLLCIFACPEVERKLNEMEGEE